MRISDWSSDVCSSDLRAVVVRLAGKPRVRIRHRVAATIAAQREEIEQLRIAQLRRADVAQRARDLVDAAGRLALPLVEHPLDLPALTVPLRAAQVARNDRALLPPRMRHAAVLAPFGTRRGTGTGHWGGRGVHEC